MQNLTYLFDTQDSHENLLPLSFTRPVADFRVGMVSIKDKWMAFMPADYRYLPVDYLQEKFGSAPDGDTQALFIAGSLLPDADIAQAISGLACGEAIIKDETLLAFRGSYDDFLSEKWTSVECQCAARIITYVFDIFRYNSEEIKNDFFRLTEGRISAGINDSNRIIGNFTDASGRQMLFIEDGASAEGAIFNLKDGPIYIGKDAEIMEGACLRGPIALCNHAIVKMGAKIYEGTTIGPYCKVGGEIDNTVFFGYSNKAHDGYLGNAVIGEWCNIGAGANASNLKNDYKKIRIWNYHTHTFMRTDLQFCGLIMGDHSKIGVNCMLNTATVFGVGVNLHGAGFPRTFVPSFSEGSPVTGFSDVPMVKFIDIARRVMSRRNLPLDDIDQRIYEKVYEVASKLKQ